MKRGILLTIAGLGAMFLLRTCTQSGTESVMLGWAQALKFHLATGGEAGDYSFPRELGEIAPELRAELSDVDTWGNKLRYRRLRDDLYQLISVGKDGQYGNADDVIVQNGAFYPSEKIYSETPP
jgi:hypothetical protein